MQLRLLKHVLVIHFGASCGTQNLLWAVLRQNCGLDLLPEVFSVNITPFTGCLCSTPFHTVAGGGGQEWAHTLWTMVMGGKCQFICPCSSSYPSLRCCPSSYSFPFFLFLFAAAGALRSHRGETHRLCTCSLKTHHTTNISFLFLFQLEELETTDHAVLSSACTAVKEKRLLWIQWVTLVSVSFR